MAGSIIPFGIALIIAYAFLRAVDKSIKVTLTSEGVVNSVRLAAPLKSRLDRFARTNVGGNQTIRFRGRMNAYGRITWSFPKSIDPAFAQQLRNYMANEVYF